MSVLENHHRFPEPVDPEKLAKVRELERAAVGDDSFVFSENVKADDEARIANYKQRGFKVVETAYDVDGNVIPGSVAIYRPKEDNT